MGMFNLFSKDDKKYMGAVQELPVFRSGWTVDEHHVSKERVLEIYRNTKKFLASGARIPLKYGHDDPTEEKKGDIVDVRISKQGKKNTKEFRYTLYANIEFTEASFALYKAGAYPDVSVEIAEKGVVEGKQIGHYLSALALLGTTPAAIPWLLTSRFHNDAVKYYSVELPGQTIKYEKDTKMDELKAFLEKIIADAQEGLALIDSQGEEEPVDPEAEADPAIEAQSEATTDDFAKAQARITELEQKLAETQEIDKTFSTLHKAGKVGVNDKALFTADAADIGLESAVRVYSRKPTRKTPPLTAVVGKDLTQNTAEPWTKHLPKWTEKGKKNGHKGDGLIAYAEKAAKMAYAAEQGGKK